MRRDAGGFFYFIDRIGDTFRWKGENVATAEVAAAVTAFPGILEANVYGVASPAPKAPPPWRRSFATANWISPQFREHLARLLPPYARPLFLRVMDKIETTATFKHTKNQLGREGYDPTATSDAIFFDDPHERAFVRLDGPLYARIQTGKVRV